MITIVDYGMGNLGSMVNMFKYLGTDVCVESEPSKIESAKKLVLPGVGKFDAAMKCIKKNDNLLDLLSYKVCEEKIPILGICLGMQLFTNSSEEGSEKGLGWIPGVVKKFPYNSDHRIPHMGWNDAVVLKKNSLVANISGNSRYYFVHSYYVSLDNDENSLMRTNHGIEFSSGIVKDNIFGLQFHPEKSHKFGMVLLKNFSDL